MLPPVGSNYLAHLFKHPEDYHDEEMTYRRTPKRKAQLRFGSGWGIHLREGFSVNRVFVFTTIAFFFVALLFAIAWTASKKDIQGAFGVAQWISGMSAIFCKFRLLVIPRARVSWCCRELLLIDRISSMAPSEDGLIPVITFILLDSRVMDTNEFSHHWPHDREVAHGGHASMVRGSVGVCYLSQYSPPGQDSSKTLSIAI